MAYKEFRQEDLILRDELALERTQLANERTLLAYLRTAIMLMVTGGTILKVFDSSPANVLTSWLIIGLGLVIAAFGLARFARVRRELNHLKQQSVTPPEQR